MKYMFYVDVDGVINSLNDLGKTEPAPHIRKHATKVGFDIMLPDYMPGLARQLYSVGHWRWLTTWGDAANSEVSPLLGLPTDLPVIDCGFGADFEDKADAAEQYAYADADDGFRVYWIEDFGARVPAHSVWDVASPVNTDALFEGVLLSKHIPEDVYYDMFATGVAAP